VPSLLFLSLVSCLTNFLRGSTVPGGTTLKYHVENNSLSNSHFPPRGWFAPEYAWDGGVRGSKTGGGVGGRKKSDDAMKNLATRKIFSPFSLLLSLFFQFPPPRRGGGGAARRYVGSNRNCKCVKSALLQALLRARASSPPKKKKEKKKKKKRKKKKKKKGKKKRSKRRRKKKKGRKKEREKRGTTTRNRARRYKLFIAPCLQPRAYRAMYIARARARMLRRDRFAAVFRGDSLETSN